MSLFESICYYSGILCFFHGAFVFYRWIISYISLPVSLKKKYNSEWALITGSNGGLGFKIALKLAEQGYNIIGTGRNMNSLEKAKNEIETKFPKIKFEPLKADFSNYESGVKVVSEKIRDPKYDIKILIINAGYGLFDPFTKLENNKIYNFISTMCTAYAQLSCEFIRKNKKIIYHSKSEKCLLYFTSSALAAISSPKSALYCGVKAYDLALASHLSVEKYGKNLDVTAMQPGLFKDSRFFGNGEKNANLDRFLPSSNEVCDCVMKTLGRTTIVDCSANSLIPRILVWIIGEYPEYLLGKFLAHYL